MILIQFISWWAYSGVGYLKIPKTFGKLEQGDKKGELNKLGRIELIHGNKMFAKVYIWDTSEVGNFYFFQII